MPKRSTSLHPALIAVLLILIVVSGVGGLWIAGGTATPAPSYRLVQPARDDLVATIKASGRLEPAQLAELQFRISGVVAEVLVREGDPVRAGDPIARLDTRELVIRRDIASTELEQARISYEQLRAGESQETIAAAEARLNQAQGQLLQTRGAVTAADLGAAEARLAQSQDLLQELEAGPRELDLNQAGEALQQSEIGLQAERDRLSTAKTDAELQMRQTTAELTQAQAHYAQARDQWAFVERTGVDPLNPNVPDPSWRNLRGTRPNEVNEYIRQQYYHAYIEAEAAMHRAEMAVERARINYDFTRQAEISGVELATSRLRDAHNAYEQVNTGATAAQLSAARAAVAGARADLER
ncbi:MAG: biotin/lipoyl-binding protein, partial [Oscillochloris sp.]|nr:biotin/lipoyl-binding protein [Oscillochloris sp.]